MYLAICMITPYILVWQTCLAIVSSIVGVEEDPHISQDLPEPVGIALPFVVIERMICPVILPR